MEDGPARSGAVHTTPIWGLAPTRDGTRIVAGSAEGNVAVWDSRSGALVHRLAGHARAVRACAVTADGRTTLSASVDGSVLGWELERGREALRLERHADGVFALAADGRCAYTGSFDSVIRIWDLATGRPLGSLSGHRDAVQSLARLPGRRLLSASRDRSVRIWDVASGSSIALTEDHPDWVSEVRVSGDGRTAVSADEQGVVRVWDVERRACSHEFAVGHPIWGADVSADGRRVAAGVATGPIHVWEVPSGRDLGSLRGHSAAARAIAFLGTREHLVSGGDDATIRVWHVDARSTQVRIAQTEEVLTFSLALAENDRLGLVGSDDGSISIWDLERRCALGKLGEHGAHVYAIRTLPDGNVISASFDGTVRIWDVGARREKVRLEVGALVFSVSTDRAGELAVTTGRDGEVWLWDLARAEVVRRFEGHRGERHVYATLTTDERYVVSGGEDGTLRCWSTGGGPAVCSFVPRDCPVSCVEAAGDGRVAVGWGDGMLSLVDPLAGTTLATYAGHQDWVRELRVTDDFEYVVSVCQDHSVAMFSLSTGERVPLSQPDVQARSLAPGPGRTIAVAAPQAAVVTWVRY